MDRSGAQSRAGARVVPRKRQPLGDGNSRANVHAASSPAQSKPASSMSPKSSSSIPHHESVAANGALTVQNATTKSSPHSVRRISEAINEEEDKRNSQLSTASTNASARGRPKKTHIGPWQLGANIGGGSVGTVRKVRHVVTGQNAAAKVIAKNTADLSRAESMAHFARTYKNTKADGNVLPFGIEREVVIMKLLEHPNIVKLYDVWENRSQLYLIMEYVEGGELFDYVKQGPLEEDETVWIFRQICAALLHAHQFRIYHRDLKPENILLEHNIDPETGRINPQIKLVDFGMAALQPRGKNLISPCGSVHYAAPEIFKKNYDGAKADVWSLGIIIYIMLVGTIPFAWNQLSTENYFLEWYNHITKGKIEIPHELSPEAKDLIRRMLTVNPRDRISLQQVWSHPLLKKWSMVWQETPAERSIEAWIGPTAPMENRTIPSKGEIDREILRNLRVLWHSESEHVLVSKLLNSEKNLEKYFYFALVRHREEQQENFIALPDELSYSTSDYHHLKPVLHPSELPPIPPSAFERTKSNFSILNDEEVKSSRSNSTKPAPSEHSYDPFRSSRVAVTNDKATNYSVTVHRGASGHSRKTSAGQSVKPNNSLRVEALKKQQRLSSSSAHLSVNKSPSPRPIGRRSMSRSSFGSSLAHGSSPSSLKVRPSDRHRRGVDFSQMRKSSTTNALSIQSSKQESYVDVPIKVPGTIVAPDDSIIESIERGSSPVAQAKPIGSRKEGHRNRRGATHSQVIETEARKVSTELETLCEVAFNRESVGSSSVTSAPNVADLYDTPPSSVSNRASSTCAQVAGAGSSPFDAKSPAPRSLSESATETPNTYITRELAEARKKIAKRYAKDEFAQQNPNYREVLAQIDAFLESNIQTRASDKLRNGWHSPDSNPSGVSAQLPSIAEKQSAEEVSLRRQALARKANGASNHKYSSSQQSDIQTTVRLIDPSSPKRPAPLNVRKTSTNSSRGSSNQQASSDDSPAHTRHYGRSAQRSAASNLSPTKPQTRHAALDAITEEAAARDALGRPAEQTKKKWNWFWKKTDEDSQAPASHRAWDMASERLRNEGFEPPSKGRKRDSNTSSGSTPRSPALPGKRPGFLSFLTKRKSAKKGEAAARDDDSLSSTHGENDNMSTVTSYTRKPQGQMSHMRQYRAKNTAGAESYSNGMRELGVQRNWLARFFHIKPATSIMCFDISRGRARQELVRILRSWRMHGIRDVVLDREKNLIFGRLTEDNYLQYKPVDFVIELFVVLEYGCRANLSLARFTQRKGAASSFRKLIATLEDILLRKGLLVENERRRQEMEGILQG